jgi:hypothetical protein
VAEGLEYHMASCLSVVDSRRTGIQSSSIKLGFQKPDLGGALWSWAEGFYQTPTLRNSKPALTLAIVSDCGAGERRSAGWRYSVGAAGPSSTACLGYCRQDSFPKPLRIQPVRVISLLVNSQLRMVSSRLALFVSYL